MGDGPRTFWSLELELLGARQGWHWNVGWLAEALEPGRLGPLVGSRATLGWPETSRLVGPQT